MLRKHAILLVVAALAFASTGYAAADDTSIRPFRVNVSDEALADLRRRIAATQWPEKETVTDLSQGLPLATMLDFAARHGVAPQTEHFPMSQINAAFARLESGKTRYRIVLDADF